MQHTPPSPVALILFACACSAPGASVTPRYGEFSVDGKFSATASGSSASSSFDDLGLDGTQGSFSPKGTLTFSGFDVDLSVLSTSFDGDGTTDGAIQIGGSTIPGNTDVDTDLKYETFTTVVTWDVVPTDVVDFGLGVGVTVVRFDMKMAETAGTESIKTDETFPVPLVAARGSVDIGPLDLTATAGYMDLSVSGNDLKFLDYDAALQYHLFGGDEHAAGHIAIGYRGYDVDADYEDDHSDVHADFTLNGPYVGLSISF